MRPSHYNTKYKNDLSPRERDVLGLVSRGQTNAEIADSLGITYETVKTHVSGVLGKLGVDSREQAAAYWRDYNSLRGRLGRGWNAVIGVITSKAVAASGVAAAIAGAAVFVAVFLMGRGDDPPTEAEAGEPVCVDVVAPFSGGDISARVCEPGDDARNLTPLILVYDCRDSLHSWDFEREAARSGFLVLVPEVYTAAEQQHCDSRSEQEFAAAASRLANAYNYIDGHDRGGARPLFVTRGDGAALTVRVGVQRHVGVLFSPPYPEEFARGFRLQAGRNGSQALVLAGGRGVHPADRSKALVDDIRAAGGYAEYRYYPNADGLWRDEDAPGAWAEAIAFLHRELTTFRARPASPPPSKMAVLPSTGDVDCRLSTFASGPHGWVPARICGPADGSDAPGLLVMFACNEPVEPWAFEVEAARAGFEVLVVDAHLDFAPHPSRCAAAAFDEWASRIPYVVNEGWRISAGKIPLPQALVARGQGATSVFKFEDRWEIKRSTGRPVILLSPEYPKGAVSPEFPHGYAVGATDQPALVMVHGDASPEQVAQAELLVADIRAGGGTATLEIIAGADEKWTNAASMASLRRALEFLKENK